MIAIQTFISAAQVFGVSKDDTVEPLADEVGITIEEAKEQVEENWDYLARKNGISNGGAAKNNI